MVMQPHRSASLISLTKQPHRKTSPPHLQSNLTPTIDFGRNRCMGNGHLEGPHPPAGGRPSSKNGAPARYEIPPLPALLCIDYTFLRYININTSYHELLRTFRWQIFVALFL